MTDEPHIGLGDRDLRKRVEGLTRELIQIIDSGTTTQREDLRDLAIDLLRHDVPVVEDDADEIAADEIEPLVETERSASGSNAFGVGLLLLLMGGVLIILFPLVGLLVFLGAAVTFAWGLIVTLFARR